MKIKTIPSTWIRAEGRRLDCGPYMSGALEAKMALRHLSCRKDRLRDVTRHGIDGIVNAGRVKRLWVNSPMHGIPFLSSSDILQADLSTAPLISNKVVADYPQLVIHQGWTLITRSGTIGRMVYARPDMDGMACSEHVMRVIADPDHIPPGYLYAFLSSKYGVPMVVGGTYGSIIQSIEPQHIADLPVPRLGEAVEQRVHELVEEAARNRSKASTLFIQSRNDLFLRLEMPAPRHESEYTRPHVMNADSRHIQARFDAFYYSLLNREARDAFDKAAAETTLLGEVAAVFIPGIFKRRYAVDSAFGYPYITGADVFNLAPTSDQFLMRKVAEEYELTLKDGMIVIQEAGQLGGLIGRSVMVGRYLDGFACTNNMIRVTPNDKSDTGFLYALLSSEYGVRLISRESAGSSIPHIDASRIRNLRIPWPDMNTRQEIASFANSALHLSDDACDLENEARSLVEQTIEGAA
jgi:type I restriction enzyme S subunit